MDSKTLKDKHRQVRDGQPDALRVRVHRAISWLKRAEAEADDQDARFLFLWIAFNAAYAQEFGFELSERDQVRQFIQKVLERDTSGRMNDALHRQFSGPIRTLVDNKFIFEPFWRGLREHDASEQWKAQFDAAKKLAMRAILEKQTDLLLSIVLDRLYVLRNQIVHGGATWNGAANRGQLRDGNAILAVILPVIIDVMIEDVSDDFAGIAYPLVESG